MQWKGRRVSLVCFLFLLVFATKNDEKGKCVRYIMLPLNPIMEFRILYHLKCSAGLESEAIPNQ